jgi:hypothetical protein
VRSACEGEEDCCGAAALGESTVCSAVSLVRTVPGPGEGGCCGTRDSSGSAGCWDQRKSNGHEVWLLPEVNVEASNLSERIDGGTGKENGICTSIACWVGAVEDVYGRALVRLRIVSLIRTGRGARSADALDSGSGLGGIRRPGR